MGYLKGGVGLWGGMLELVVVVVVPTLLLLLLLPQLCGWQIS
jgi:hypothetical protein